MESSSSIESQQAAYDLLLQGAMADLATLSAVIERTLADLDRHDDELRHENTDVTIVMNWIASVRQRARMVAPQNVKTLELSPLRAVAAPALLRRR